MAILGSKTIDIGRLLQTKNPSLARRLPPVMLWLLRALLHEHRVNRTIERLAHRKGVSFADAILRRLRVDVTVAGFSGSSTVKRPIFVANHPTGGLEGLAMIRYIGGACGDVAVPANDILGLIPQLRPLFLDVDVFGSRATSVRALVRLCESDRPILLFPAGVTARTRGSRLVEYPWHTGFVRLARHHRRPIIPVHVEARNSWFFYTVWKLRRLLRVSINLEMMMLVDELIRKQGSRLGVTIGTPIPPEHLDGRDPAELAVAIRGLVVAGCTGVLE